MRHSRGFSMIELLIALGATTVLLGVSVSMVHRAMSSHALARQHEQLQHASLRLARQFRHDVRSAQSAVVADDSNRITLQGTPGDSEVSYLLSDGRVNREQLGDSGVPQREVFSLPGAATSAELLTDPPRVVVTIYGIDSLGASPSRVMLRLETVIGGRTAIHRQEVTP